MTTTTSTHSTKFGELLCTVDLASINARLGACCSSPQNRSSTGDSVESSGTTYAASGHEDESGQQPPKNNSDVSDASKATASSERKRNDLDGIVLTDVTDGFRDTPDSKGIERMTPAITTRDSCNTQRGGVTCVRNVRDLHGTAERVITTPDALSVIAASVGSARSVALDIETYGDGKRDGLDPWKGDIRFLTLRVDGHDTWLLDLRSIGYDLGVLKAALESVEVIIHNANFDLLWLSVKCDIRPMRVFCTLTAARLLTAGGRTGNDLDQCLLRYLGIFPESDMAKSDWGAILLTQEQLRYAERDVEYLQLLAARLSKLLEEAHLQEVVRLEMALLPVIVDMEASGIAVDTNKLKMLRDRAQMDAHSNGQQLRLMFQQPTLNPSSPKQLVAALRQMGIAVEGTAEEALLKVDDGNVIPMILKFRGAEKAGQQAKKLLEAIAQDGRIHGRFDSTGTMTGRFSSSKPNLQNIGRGPLRACFVPANGHKLIVADYSQIELRVAAVISGEAKMIQAYEKGCDLHRQTAAFVLGKEPDEVTKEDRQLAKAVNFGLLYGQGKDGLIRYAAGNYGVELSSDEAELIRSRFFGTYTALAGWHRRCWRLAERGAAEARTIMNRRRIMADDATDWERFTALANTPVQGGSADGMKRAMLRLHQELPTGARMISTVHDELIVEVREDLAVGVCEQVRSVMCAAMAELFPSVLIEVEAHVCETWADK
jgi:DNA polymerase-1